MNNIEAERTREILKKVRTIEIKTRGVVNELFSGEYHSVFKGRGMEFSEVREYKFGDDIRSIDWNVSARMGHPYVKVYQEERELVLVLMVDLSASQSFGSMSQMKNEIAAELAAVLAFSALKNNDKVGLILFSDQIELFVPPQKGKSHVLRCLRELLFFKPKRKGTNIGTALEYLNKVLKKKAIVFLISDFWGKDFDTPMKIAGARHDFVAVRLFDRREMNLPQGTLIRLTDSESGRMMSVDLRTATLRERYRQASEDHFSRIKLNLQKYGGDYLEVDTSGDYVNSLIGFFRKRGKKR